MRRTQEVPETQPLQVVIPGDEANGSGSGSGSGSGAGPSSVALPLPLATPQRKEAPLSRSNKSIAQEGKKRTERLTVIDEEVAAKYPELWGKYGASSVTFAHHAQKKLEPDFGLTVVTKLVFIPVAADADASDIKAAILAKQAKMYNVPVAALNAGDWSVQRVTPGTLQASGSTHPGNWSLTGQKAKDRALLYFRMATGVVTILLTRPMQQAAPLCPPPYIFLKFSAEKVRADGKDVEAVGVNICRVEATAAAAAPAGDVSAGELLRMVCRNPRARGFEGTYLDFIKKAEELFPVEFAAAVKRRVEKKGNDKGADLIFFKGKLDALTVPSTDGKRPALLKARQEARGNRTVTVWTVL
jgi:hypothetical protein